MTNFRGTFNDPYKQAWHFENIVERGENAGNQHFLLFLQSFLPYYRQKSPFCWLFANAMNLVRVKILLQVKSSYMNLLFFLLATCYKNAKALTEARDMYVKAAEMHEKMKAYPFTYKFMLMRIIMLNHRNGNIGIFCLRLLSISMNLVEIY